MRILDDAVLATPDEIFEYVVDIKKDLTVEADFIVTAWKGWIGKKWVPGGTESIPATDICLGGLLCSCQKKTL